MGGISVRQELYSCFFEIESFVMCDAVLFLTEFILESVWEEIYEKFSFQKGWLDV